MSAQAILAALSPAVASQGASSPAIAADDGGADFAALIQSEVTGATIGASSDAAVEASIDDQAALDTAPDVAEAQPGAPAPDPTLGLILLAQAPVALPVTVAAEKLAQPVTQTAEQETDTAGETLATTPTVMPEPLGKPAPIANDGAPRDAAAVATPQTDRPLPEAAASSEGVSHDDESSLATSVVEGATTQAVERKSKTDIVTALTPSPSASPSKEREAGPAALKALPERTARAGEIDRAALEPATRSDGPASQASPRPSVSDQTVTSVAALRPDQAPPTRSDASPAMPVSPAPDAPTTAPRVEVAVADSHPHAQMLSTENATGMSRIAVEATAQIAAQILRKLEGRSTRFEMALLPEELGRVDVKLDIDNEGRLAARLAFDNPAAAADLRGRVDDLRRQLEQQGFNLAGDAFEFTERDPGSNAFDRGQEQRGRGRAFAAASRIEADAEVAAVARFNVSLSPAGVDVRV